MVNLKPLVTITSSSRPVYSGTHRGVPEVESQSERQLESDDTDDMGPDANPRKYIAPKLGSKKQEQKWSGLGAFAKVASRC